MPSMGDDDPRVRPRPKRKATNMVETLYWITGAFISTKNAWDKRFPSWRSGLAGFSILAAVVLLVNGSALVWAATHLDDGPYATIAVQDCKSNTKWSFYMYWAISILSTGLLAGSNYCIQCLTSPTREEVDAAHARSSYLNIGIISWRNVTSARKRRMGLLFGLLLSSVPLHAVYDRV
jgi:hypothetical protein